MKRPPALAQQRFAERRAELERLPLADRFQEIYRTNLWGSSESVSGQGSALGQTARLRQELTALFHQVGATSLLDVPCGDFGWMSQVDLTGIDYTGADIVPELVAANQERYGRRFLHLDLTRDPLPRADVVFCRDCLVHLSLANVQRALANIRRSGARWLLTTTFLEHDTNTDIADGDWRMLNFTRAPFLLPEPEAVLLEGCTEEGGAYADKALGLWRCQALPEASSS